MHPVRFLIHLALSVAAVAITAYLLPGVSFESITPVIVATVVLGLLNSLLRPIINLLTLPINMVTLGLFGLVLNALFVLGTASLVQGFVVNSFWWAVAFSIVLSLVHGVLHMVEKKN